MNSDPDMEATSNDREGGGNNANILMDCQRCEHWTKTARIVDRAMNIDHGRVTKVKEQSR